MFRRSIAAALTPVVALALAACGQTTAATESEGAAPATSSTCEGVKTTTGPVSLTDSYGRKEELEEPADRVAVLEWQQTEDLLTLCVNPVGVADAKGFSTWVSAEELPKGAPDVGTRAEPNRDALSRLTPTHRGRGLHRRGRDPQAARHV
jgi:iron complex transport system substrate-binding protein